MWAAAFLIANTSILITITAIYQTGILISPFDAIVATLAGMIILNMLMTVTGMSSFTATAERPAAGFSLLFSSVALCTMFFIVYTVLTSDTKSETEQNNDNPTIELPARIQVSTIT